MLIYCRVQGRAFLMQWSKSQGTCIRRNSFNAALPPMDSPRFEKLPGGNKKTNLSASLRLGAVLVLLLMIVLVGAAMLGAERLSLFDLSEQQRSILFDIRLPRILLGACVGASLAVAGAGLQSLLRNPLAEPYLLGVSNGAALGTLLAFVFFQGFEFLRPVMAFAGAALAMVAVYRMAKSRAGMNVERLVLSGVIATTFLSSVIVMLTTLLDAAKLRSY